MDNIIKQLINQEIQYEIIQSEYSPSENSEVRQTVKKWCDKFISNKSAPNLDSYLWHIFSFGATKSFEGKAALEELNKQWIADVLIFNESQQYLIRCNGKIPILEMEDFMDDIYLCHHNMKWTYVVPHEIPDLGPYFST
jgi:hypothetical protein